MKILDYAVARKLGIAFSGGAHSLAEKAIAQKLGGGSGGNTGGGGVAHLTFYNEDGTSVLQIVECKDGADGAYTGSTPTKASTAQYTYSFAGWSRTIGGAVDPDAMKNVTADRILYAAFTATVRTYTVTWKNGSTTLETDTNVPYGTVPTYNGADPVDAGGLPFIGWEPAVGAVTGDATYTAQFKSYTYVKLIERNISGVYANDAATSIGENTFYNSKNITAVSFANAASIGGSAFSGCVKLSKADFAKATSIDVRAFSACHSLTALILRSESVCSLKAFSAFDNCYHISGTTNSTYNPDGLKDGYIYVPRALLDSYKTGYMWRNYATQYRAIEDYPDICGGESA